MKKAKKDEKAKNKKWKMKPPRANGEPDRSFLKGPLDCRVWKNGCRGIFENCVSNASLTDMRVIESPERS